MDIDVHEGEGNVTDPHVWVADKSLIEMELNKMIKF